MSLSLYVEYWIEFGTEAIIASMKQAYRFIIKKQGKSSVCWPLNSIGALKGHVHFQIFFKLVPSSRAPTARNGYF